MEDNKIYPKGLAISYLLTSPYFERLLSDIKCCEYILRTLFRRDDIHVIESEIMIMTPLRPDSMWVQVKAKNNDGEPVSFGLQLESEFLEDMMVVLDELVKRTKDSHECYAVSFEQTDVLRLNNPMHVIDIGIKRKNGMFKGPSLAYMNVNTTEEPYKSLLQQLCSEADKNPDGRLKVPVRIMMDDFAASARIPDFDKIISVIRSREISVSIILQSLTQLRSMYSYAEATTITNNCDHLLYLGSQDMDTANFIACRVCRTPETVMCMPRDKAVLITSGEKARFVDKVKPYSTMV